MTTNPTSNQPEMPTRPQNDDEINLSQVFDALLRHKFLIAKITAASVLLTGLYAFTRKPVWQGQFEIVLASTQAVSSPASSLLQKNPGLANLIGASVGNDQLETEVKILESPSVLKPVFDYVKQLKKQKRIDVEGWRYSSWVEGNLTIELVNGTSVLELTYRDTDKDLVLPVIQKISEAYQDYSGRDRKRGIKQAIEYINQQIKIYTDKGVKSFRAYQEYAIEHNLAALQAGGGAEENQLNNTLNIEGIRIEASNQIRNIDEQIKQLNKLDDEPETLMYIGRTITQLASKSLSEQLDQIDTRLALLRSNYKDQDESILKLLEQRRQLIDVFKRQTYGHLNAQRSAAKARLKSAERPKGVLIKYRELLRTAARDEATLTRLESEHQILSLEQARKEEPWELISTPTLLDQPVAPRKKRMVALGLLLGLFGGSGAALLVDRRTGLVYSEDELKILIPCPLIKHLPAMGQSTWTDAVDLLAGGPLAKVPGNSAIALIPIGNMPNEQLQAFSAELSRALRGRELIVSTDLRKTSRCATQLLVTSQGVATRTQLSQLRQKLALQGTPMAGWVLLDPELNLG